MPERDLERIREILLLLEGDLLDEFESGWMWTRNTDYFSESDNYQLVLMNQAGLVELSDRTLASVVPDRLRLTFVGHDYLEAIKSEGVWEETKKAVAETGGNVTLDIMKQLAIGFLKKKLEQHTDIEL